MLRTHRIAHRLAAVLGLALLAGCYGPSGTISQFGLQRDAVSLRDWNASVARVVASMAAEGVIADPKTPDIAAHFPGPYYVHVMAPGSTFLEEARQALERELMRRGAGIARVPDGATVLNLDIDVVSRGASVGRSLLDATDTEAIWRITIVTNDRVAMKTGDTVYIAAEDEPLFSSSTTLAPLASPGASLIGAARALRYAR